MKLRAFQLLLVVALITGCKQAKNESGKDAVFAENPVQACTNPAAVAKGVLQADPLAFIPKGYVFSHDV